MAERRMFAKTVVLSDDFLDMSATARCLYFCLGVVADDDGFINNARSVMRQCCASESDESELIKAGFIIKFTSGVIVIRHWHLNNYIRSDRYTPTKCSEELDLLDVENDVYTLVDVGIPAVDQRYTSGTPTVDTGKVSSGEVSSGEVSTAEGVRGNEYSNIGVPDEQLPY